MRKPTIHLNGSDAQSLFDGYYAAFKAVKAAREALAATAPHGRDYYPQGQMPDGKPAVYDAISEHRIRLARLDFVENALQELALHVMETAEAQGKPVKR